MKEKKEFVSKKDKLAAAAALKSASKAAKASNEAISDQPQKSEPDQSSSLTQTLTDIQNLGLTPTHLPPTPKKQINIEPTKESLNLVVVGHVDAGKSTLTGHLLTLHGDISTRAFAKLQKEATTSKKASFAYAWVMDATTEERERGVTVDVGVAGFESEIRFEVV